MRMKLGDALGRRDLAPHIFETREEANAFHGAAAMADADGQQIKGVGQGEPPARTTA
jgi:hypothetical protein